MSTQTTNLHLVKPDGNETVDIDDINDNMDILDSVISAKVDKTGDTITGNLNVTGNIFNNGEQFFPTFIRSSITGYVPTVSPCLVMDTSDWKLYHYANGMWMQINQDTHVITGVKGDAESTYRTGNVNLTSVNIGALAKTDNMMAATKQTNVDFYTWATTAANIHKTGLNDEVVHARFYAESYANYNLPCVDSHIIVYSIDNGVNWMRCVAFDIRTNAVYVNERNSGTWQGWVQLSLNGHTHSYLPLSGGTLTGNLTVGNVVNAKNSTLNRDGAAPSANVWGSDFVGLDKDGERVSIWETCQDTANAMNLYMRCYNEKSDGTQVENYLLLKVNKDGTKAVVVSDGAAWRQGLAAMCSVTANGYEGMGRRDGNTSDWIRTTSSGLIPYASGGSSSSLGTSGWPFSNLWAQQVYGTNTVQAGNGTYRLVMGGGGSYSWIDCRNSSGTVQNNIVLAPTYTQIGKNLRVNAQNFCLPYARFYSTSSTANPLTIGKTAAQWEGSSYNSYIDFYASSMHSKYSFVIDSDKRVKNHVSYVEKDDAADFIKMLKPAVYSLKSDSEKKLHLGFYAQDVGDADTWETSIVEEYNNKSDDGPETIFTLDYTQLHAPIVAALQSALDRIEKLEAEIAELKELLKNNV